MRIARQLAKSPSIVSCSGDSIKKTAVKVDVISEIGGRTLGRPISLKEEFSSPAEMLSQLCLTARDPLKRYSFVPTIVRFFTDLRNSISLERSCSTKFKKSEKKTKGGERSLKTEKPSNAKVSSTETDDYVVVNDYYWTDQVIQSSPEEQLSHKSRKRKVNAVQLRIDDAEGSRGDIQDSGVGTNMVGKCGSSFCKDCQPMYNSREAVTESGQESKNLDSDYKSDEGSEENNSLDDMNGRLESGDCEKDGDDVQSSPADVPVEDMLSDDYYEQDGDGQSDSFHHREINQPTTSNSKKLSRPVSFKKNVLKKSKSGNADGDYYDNDEEDEDDPDDADSLCF